MSVLPNYVPRAYNTISVNLIVPDADKAIKFYNSAFDAELLMKLEDPSGRVVHAEINIDGTILMLSEGATFSGESPVILQLYSGDVEGLWEQAMNAGAEEVSPIKVEFYGDRAGKIKDPFGFYWRLATHVEDVTARELQKRFHEIYP